MKDILKTAELVQKKINNGQNFVFLGKNGVGNYFKIHQSNPNLFRIDAINIKLIEGSLESDLLSNIKRRCEEVKKTNSRLNKNQLVWIDDSMGLVKDSQLVHDLLNGKCGEEELPENAVVGYYGVSKDGVNKVGGIELLEEFVDGNSDENAGHGILTLEKEFTIDDDGGLEL